MELQVGNYKNWENHLLDTYYNIASMAASSSKIASFSLLDGTTIPWLAWGNGSGKARTTALESGLQAVAAGIRHIDTAQGYKNEGSTGEIVAKSDLNKDDIYVTTKCK